jgi:hypothetical protein
MTSVWPGSGINATEPPLDACVLRLTANAAEAFDSSGRAFFVR